MHLNYGQIEKIQNNNLKVVLCVKNVLNYYKTIVKI